MKSKIFILSFAVSLLAFSVQADNGLDFYFKDSSKYKDVIVARVISTDLIELESGEKIRLIGLSAPEVPRVYAQVDRDSYGFPVKEKASPLSTIEEQSIEFAKELMEKKHVRLEFDVERTDEGHRSYAYVFMLENNLFVNTEILRQGFANLQIRPPNMKYVEEFREAYREASREHRGLQSK